jgi:hypothetical protein
VNMDRRQSKGRSIRLRLCIWLILCSLPSHSLFADAFSERRASVGLNLFRTFVGADQHLDERRDAQGNLIIYLLYVGDDRAALGYQLQLQQTMAAVHDIPVQTEVVSLLRMQEALPLPAAVFVAEKLSHDERQWLVNYSIRYRLAVFSPFEGDVEQGILGGLAVEASVRPLVNIKTLKASKVALKPFYLSVARQYE